MHLKKISLLALSIGTFSLGAEARSEAESATEAERRGFQATRLKSSNAQSEAKGFVEDQALSGWTRNFFAQERTQRDTRFSINKGNGRTETTRLKETWTQGTVLDYSSGFTQGTVGIAAQVAAYNEIALQQGKGRIAGGGNRTLTDHDGEAVEQWSKLGLANLKARVSHTTLTAGRMAYSSPIVDVIGNRALPSSFEGIAINSAEFDNLTFDFAAFDRVSPRTEQSQTRFTSENADRSFTSDHVALAGLSYQPFHNLATKLYAANVKDFWNQYYLNIEHSAGDNASLQLDTAFNYYKTRDTGQRKLGAIDNNTYSLSLTASHQAHSLTLAYQEVDGNEYFDYLHETNGIYLANSLFSDFNGPNEKSVQVAYALDMAGYGVPGLAMNIYTARGWGIDGTHYKGGAYDVLALDGDKHIEYGIGASYVIQSGALKNSRIKATYATHRASANQVDGSLRELRVVTQIPFNLL
jgi:hypothetical protein